MIEYILSLPNFIILSICNLLLIILAFFGFIIYRIYVSYETKINNFVNHTYLSYKNSLMRIINYIKNYFKYRNFHQTISYYELDDLIDIGERDLYVIDIFDKEYVYMRRNGFCDLEKYFWKDFLWIKNISLEKRNKRLIEEVKKSIYNKDKERFMIYQETMKEIEQIN